MPKPSNRNVAPPKRVGSNLNVWLPDSIMYAFNELRRETGRSKTTETLFMMREYLANHGKPQIESDE